MKKNLKKQIKKKIMKIKIKTSFSFKKLASKIPEMIENYFQDGVDSTVANIRNIIDTRNHEKPELGISTIRKREANMVGGLSWGSTNYGDIPLNYTGKLYNTLRSTPEGIVGQEYTKFHHRGVHDKVGGEWVKRPKRSILKFKGSEEGLKKFGKSLKENLKK